MRAAHQPARSAAAARVHELMRFALVGVVNAGTYFALYTVLVLAGVPYVLAAVLAFPLPVALGYWLHEHWTFERGEPTARGLAGFLAIHVAALGLGLVVLIALVDGLGVGAIPARAISIPLAPAFTYLLSRAWIFRGRDG